MMMMNNDVMALQLPEDKNKRPLRVNNCIDVNIFPDKN